MLSVTNCLSQMHSLFVLCYRSLHLSAVFPCNSKMHFCQYFFFQRICFRLIDGIKLILSLCFYLDVVYFRMSILLLIWLEIPLPILFMMKNKSSVLEFREVLKCEWKLDLAPNNCFWGTKTNRSMRSNKETLTSITYDWLLEIPIMIIYKQQMLQIRKGKEEYKIESILCWIGIDIKNMIM